MDKRGIFLLLALVSTILARPQYDDYPDEADPCSTFFEDADDTIFTVSDIDAVTRAEKLTYGCADISLCDDGRNAEGVTLFGAGAVLAGLINSAQNAKCPGDNEVCCNVKKTLVPIPEEEPKCLEKAGYSCVSTVNCKGDVNADEHMKAVCEGTFEEVRSVPEICCADADVFVPPPKCSDPKLADHEYRCASKDKCQGNSIDKRSSLGSLLTPAILAESATCSSESEVCCHEADIKLPCTDYEADGYKCSETCIDLPQDLPKEGDRKSNIKYYDPKNTECPRQGHFCCKRTEPPPPPPPPPGPAKCEDWGEGYACSRMELCDPNTFAVIEVSAEDQKEQTVNDLFNPGELFTQNAEDGIAVNTDLVPCESPLAVCCVAPPPPPPVPPPPPAPQIPDTVPDTGPAPCPDGSPPNADGICQVCEPKPVKKDVPTQCGTHNPNGIKRNGVTQKQTGASTQEGEWPHACLLFNEGKSVGGASLIAPGVLVTAAHLLEIKDGDSITKMKAENLKVRCGEWDLRSGDFETFAHQEQDVDTYTIHPYYSGQGKKTAIQLANDIAIIHTKEDFSIAPNVNTICLPSFDKPTIKGLCTSMGWGVNSPEAEAAGEDIMKQVRLNEEVDRDICKNAIIGSGKVPKVWLLDDSWICAQASKEESPDNILCKGDGGGPLVCQEQGSEKHVLSGIIAFGIGCGNTEIPDVFASVHDALCFIDYEVKCKHGDKFITHFDYKKDCGSWYHDEVERLKKIPLKIFKRQLRKLNALADTCAPLEEIDIAAIGGRSDLVCHQLV